MSKDDQDEAYDIRYSHLSLDALQKARKRMRIDKNDLDYAVSDQPVLFSDVADRAAEAVSIRDAASAAVEDVEARLGRAIRRKRREEKITEKLIGELIKKEREYVDAFEFYLMTKERANRWNALKAAFEQRKDMLKVMGQLYAANYFSTGSLEGDRNLEDICNQSRRKRLRQVSGKQPNRRRN